MKTGKILVVDDNKSALSALQLLFSFEFETVVCLSSPQPIASELRKHEFDVVVLDMNFSAGVNNGNEGLFWLGEIKKLAPATEVVLITAYGEVDLAVRALKQGAADFVLKPWENEKLMATVLAALQLRRSRQEVSELRKRESGLKKEFSPEPCPLVGSSQALLRVMQLIGKVAKTTANVLITGENGTGKELVARELHRQSDRNQELMITVDMGSIPEHLFESELFGHKKGAFTDARESRTGKFQLAHGGTLFLDEIGNLPLPMQAKLLVVLQSRTVVPVGSNQASAIDIRLISATNGNLDQLVAKGQFREDLLYRMNTIQIEVPPLRERGEDVEQLAVYFLKRYERKYQKPPLKLSLQAIRKLMKYDWPGNVRELQHTLEKAVILAESDTLRPEDFVFRAPFRQEAGKMLTLEAMERQMIEDALDRHNGNLTAAANQLGVTRQTLHNKLNRYDR